MGIERRIGRRPGRLGTYELGHVGFGAAWFTSVEHFGRFKTQQIGRFRFERRLEQGGTEYLGSG